MLLSFIGSVDSLCWLLSGCKVVPTEGWQREKKKWRTKLAPTQNYGNHRDKKIHIITATVSILLLFRVYFSSLFFGTPLVSIRFSLKQICRQWQNSMTQYDMAQHDKIRVMGKIRRRKNVHQPKKVNIIGSLSLGPDITRMSLVLSALVLSGSLAPFTDSSLTYGLFQLQMRISFPFLLTKNIHRFLLLVRTRSSSYGE